MKSGVYNFIITEKSVQNFNNKYKNNGLFFRRVNGSYNDSFYKEYRDVQKQILLQLLSLNSIPYKKQNLTENMSLNYKDEFIEINFSDWKPEITLELSCTDENIRCFKKFKLENCYVENQVELFLI